MATLAEQVAAMQAQMANLQAMIQGSRDQGVWYAMLGSACVYGCKITAPALSGAGMVLALDGQATGDSAHLNPDLQASPARPEEYANIANIYGEVFLMGNRNKTAVEESSLAVSTAPSTGYHRFDLVYAYVGVAGPAVAIAAGAPVLNASTPADPSVPHGVLLLARVHVQAGVTSIGSGDITDLRSFRGRLGSNQDAVDAQAAATSATSQAAAAAGSASSAATSATTSANSATAALAASASASGSAASATAQATTATTQAGIATTQATAATTQAVIATTKALEAAASAAIAVATTGTFMHPNRIDADMTIPSGYNAVTIGPFEVGPDTTVSGLGNSTWRGL